MVVSGSKDSLLGQVEQLNAWLLLLKGFELCSSSPQAHPPPAVCLLISACQQWLLCSRERPFKHLGKFTGCVLVPGRGAGGW